MDAKYIIALRTLFWVLFSFVWVVGLFFGSVMAIKVSPEHPIDFIAFAVVAITAFHWIIIASMSPITGRIPLIMVVSFAVYALSQGYPIISTLFGTAGLVLGMSSGLFVAVLYLGTYLPVGYSLDDEKEGRSIIASLFIHSAYVISSTSFVLSIVLYSYFLGWDFKTLSAATGMFAILSALFVGLFRLCVDYHEANENPDQETLELRKEERAKQELIDLCNKHN